MKLLKIASAIILFLVAYATAFTGIGEVAPDFTLTSSDGNSVSLSNFHGKIVVLSILADMNGQCIRFAQALEEDIWSKYDHSVEVMVILKGSTKIEANTWKILTGVSFTVLADPTETVWENYRETGDDIPLSFVIDKNAIIRSKDTSYFTNNIDSEVEALITAGIRQTTWWRIKQLFNKSN